MIDDTPKPKRGRRRWVIVGVLLFVVGSAVWWDWPRVDPRLVGKWKVTTSEPDFRLGSFQLTPDGQGEVLISRIRAGTNYATTTLYKFPWRQQGGSLVISHENKSRWTFWNRALMACYSYTRNPAFLEREPFSMTMNGDGTMELRREGDETLQSFLPGSFSLTRIPE